MTHGWEGDDGRPLTPQTLVTIKLDERDDKTEMVFPQTGFDDAAMRDGHGGGWTEAFDALEKALALADKKTIQNDHSWHPPPVRSLASTA